MERPPYEAAPRSVTPEAADERNYAALLELIDHRHRLTQAGHGKLIITAAPRVRKRRDEQMERIAAKMGDYYVDQGYWEHLASAVEHITETH